jgi:hypothetical protein
MVMALQTLVTRRFDVFDPVVLTVGLFQAGTWPHVVPNSAHFEADRDLKPRTRALYRGLLDRRILPTLGSKPLASLTTADIRRWHADQDATQPTARAHAYALLRTILGSTVIDGEMPVNPCHIRAASSTTRRHRIEPASMPQLEMIMGEMPGAVPINDLARVLVCAAHR